MKISEDLRDILQSEQEINLSKPEARALKGSSEDLEVLKIREHIFDKMLYVAKHAFEIKRHAVESYWLLLGNYDVEEILIPKQIVHGASVRVPLDAVVEMQRQIRKDHLKVLGWGHSHANFGVFFSGTDRFNQKNVFNGTTNYYIFPNGQLVKYAYGLTINIHGDSYGRLTYQERKGKIMHKEIPVEIIKTGQKFNPKTENLDLKRLIQ